LNPSGGRDAPQRRHCSFGRYALGLVLALSTSGSTLTPALAQDVRVLDLITNDLIYDPVSERIYASVPSAAGPGLADTITVIEPVTGAIESSVVVGSEPGPLAISDDSQFIYVGLDGVGAIRRYHIATATPGLQFSLGSDPFWGPYSAEDIEVLPGAPHSIAVSRKRPSSPKHAGVVVYDDDVMRPNVTQVHTGSNRIEFSASASLLYGFNNETSEYGFRQISITAEGAVEIAVYRNLFRTADRHDFEYEQGVAYGTTGRAIDPDAPALLAVFDAAGPVEPDAALGKVFFLDHDRFSSVATLKTFDIATFILENSTPITGIAGTTTGSLIRWGADGLAFRSDGGQVFLISGFPPPPEEPGCTVELNQPVYLDGDEVIATSMRLTNPTSQAISVQGWLWFDRPDAAPYRMPGILPEGTFELPPESDQELGPVTLATVTANLPRGSYAFDCRLIDPVTTDYVATDVNPFELQ